MCFCCDDLVSFDGMIMILRKFDDLYVLLLVECNSRMGYFFIYVHIFSFPVIVISQGFVWVRRR